jgi:hypothetical protein
MAEAAAYPTAAQQRRRVSEQGERTAYENDPKSDEPQEGKTTRDISG